MVLLAYSLVFFFINDDGSTFRAAVDGIPSARYCRHLGRENASPDLGWYCATKVSRKVLRVP